MLYATVPLSTALLAATMGVERLAARQVVAAALAIVGVAIIFAGEIRLDVPPVGLLAVFLAAMTSASMIGVVVPVIAGILGAVAKAEQRSPESYLGAVVVLIAVVIALRPSLGILRSRGPAVAK